MGAPTSEVGYTTAMPRREEHEVRKDMWWHWEEEKGGGKYLVGCFFTQYSVYNYVEYRIE
jgi:hypothetical protein